MSDNEQNASASMTSNQNSAAMTAADQELLNKYTPSQITEKISRLRDKDAALCCSWISTQAKADIIESQRRIEEINKEVDICREEAVAYQVEAADLGDKLEVSNQKLEDLNSAIAKMRMITQEAGVSAIQKFNKLKEILVTL